MKLLICILIVAVVHQSWSFPVSEQATTLKEVAPPSPVDVKPAAPAAPAAAAADAKSDSFSTTALPVETPVVAEVSLAKKEAVKEEAAAAPAAPSVEKIPVKEDSTPEAVKPSTAVFDGQSNKVSESTNNVADIGKSAAEVKPETQPIKPAPVTEQKSEVVSVEPIAKNVEPQKEANNQINAVSVDEPKPVQNEVKSEIPKDEVKSDVTKTDLPADKKEEVKTDKIVPSEAEPAKHPHHEPIKSQPAAISEEKDQSSEQELSKENEKKDSSEKVSSEEKTKSEESEEMPATQPEKKVEEPKKEEKKEEKEPKEKTELKEEKGSKVDSSSKLISESLVTEAAKSPSSPAPAVVEKSEQDRDVIKREAANKEKHDEKKSTDLLKKEKVTPQVKETFVNKDIKSSKGQDKPVH